MEEGDWGQERERELFGGSNLISPMRTRIATDEYGRDVTFPDAKLLQGRGVMPTRIPLTIATTKLSNKTSVLLSYLLGSNGLWLLRGYVACY